MKRFTFFLALSLALLALLGLALPAHPARAATCTVTSDLDDGSASTLRVLLADATCDTINFNGDYTIYLASTLTIDRNVTVDGSGHTVVISGDSNDNGTGDVQIMVVYTGVTAGLRSLTLEKGYMAGNGGAVLNYGTLTVTDSTFSGNSVNAPDWNGGAILNDGGTLTVTGSTFSGNNAGSGAAIAASGQGQLTVENSSFTGNHASVAGVIYANAGTASVENSTFSGNSAQTGGGGIYVSYGGTLTVTNSTFSGNSAYAGGAINDSSGATLTVTNSTFSGNSAQTGGGGIYVSYGGTLTLTNSTFSGNINTYFACYGGAIYAYYNAGVAATNNTFVGNTPPTMWACSSLYSYNSSMDLQNNIIVSKGYYEVCIYKSGSTTVTGANNLTNNSECASRIPGTTLHGPLLGSLGDYGGSTQTYPLLPGSPAIDGGNSACPSTDQRGKPRVGTCDIGSFESQGFMLTKLGGDNQVTSPTTAFADPLLVGVTGTGNEPVDGGWLAFSAPSSGASAALSAGTVTISGGQASVTATANSIVGLYEVTAGNIEATPVAFHLTNKGDTTTTLTSSLDPSTYGDEVTFTAVVAISPPGSGEPTGSVTFYEQFGPGGGAPKIQAQDVRASKTTTKTVRNGVTGGALQVVEATYTFTTSSLSGGVHNIFSVYNGDAATNSSTSNTVAQTVNQAPTITKQPADQTVLEGQGASFTSAALGYPVPAVQWQVSTDGGATWGDIDGATEPTLTFTASFGMNGYKYHAVFTNGLGQATTNAATLTVYVPPVITTQPASVTVNEGETATFTAAASGSPAPTVQWQVSTDGGATWNDIAGATDTTLTFTASYSQNGYQYHAVFTNAAGRATSDAATLTVNQVQGPSADVGVTKTTNAKPMDSKITYTIVVTNAGPSPAEGVVLTDPLPAGTTFVSATATQGSCKAGKNKVITCTIGTMNVGASVTIALVVKRTNFTIDIVNTATVSSTTPDPNPANNTASVTVSKK